MSKSLRAKNIGSEGLHCLQQDIQAHVQGFVRKIHTLADALHQKGRTPAALKHLGHSIALLASQGIAVVRLCQPLVQCYVNLRAKLQGRPSSKSSSQAGPRYSPLSKLCDHSEL